MKIEEALDSWGSYQGAGKKPEDFDRFWQEAKGEVETLGSSYELNRVDFFSSYANCYYLTFQGVGGGQIYCQILKPKQLKGQRPAIFQFHGYHSNSGDWSDKLALVAAGYIVVAMDVRGQGGRSTDKGQSIGGTLKGHLIRGIEEGPKNLFYRSIYQDIYQMINIIQTMADVDGSQMYSYGVSQGGALALVCAAFCPEIKKCFVQYPFLSDFRAAFELDVEQSAYEELAYYFRFRDPQHITEDRFFASLDYIDVQYFAEYINAKVWWGIGLEDRICHPKTQFAVYNHIQTKKEMIFYPEYGHEYLPQFHDKMYQLLESKGE